MMRLRVASDRSRPCPVTAEINLPATRAGILTLSTNGARQLAEHLDRLAALCDEVSAVEP